MSALDVKTAIVVLIIPVVRPEATPESFVDHLAGLNESAFYCAQAARELFSHEWRLQQPFVDADGGELGDVDQHHDVVVFFRKEFDDCDAMIAEAKSLGAIERWGFSYMWNETGTKDNGWPDYEWGGEL